MNGMVLISDYKRKIQTPIKWHKLPIENTLLPAKLHYLNLQKLTVICLLPYCNCIVLFTYNHIQLLSLFSSPIYHTNSERIHNHHHHHDLAHTACLSLSNRGIAIFYCFSCTDRQLFVAHYQVTTYTRRYPCTSFSFAPFPTSPNHPSIK